MNENNATAVLWRRLPYMLSPQMDLYERLAPIVQGQTVLEVGFGTGIGVLQYANSASSVHALEIDAAAVRFAERCFPLPNVRWLEDDILNFARHPVYYDFLIMIEVLEHIQDSDLVMRIIASLAKSAIITVPNFLRHRRKPERLNEHEWTPRSFADMLGEYFGEVKLLDYELKETADLDSRETPIIALCSSAS